MATTSLPDAPLSDDRMRLVDQQPKHAIGHIVACFIVCSWFSRPPPEEVTSCENTRR